MVYVPVEPRTPLRQFMDYIGLASLGDFKDYIKTPQSDDPDFKDILRQQKHEQLQPKEKG